MKKIEAVIIMKKLGLSILLATICISRSWAGDEPPTVESNKNLIDLVQSHADYVWTLVAAALVFFMMEGLDFTEHGGNAYPDFEVSYSYGGVGSSMGPGSPSTTGDTVGQFEPVEQT